jgi:hypothetical protein
MWLIKLQLFLMFSFTFDLFIEISSPIIASGFYLIKSTPNYGNRMIFLAASNILQFQVA